MSITKDEEVAKLQFIDCPHWNNDYHNSWKREQGLWMELTAPGEPEYSLRLCPICARLVEQEVMRRMVEPILKREAMKLLRQQIDKP